MRRRTSSSVRIAHELVAPPYVAIHRRGAVPRRYSLAEPVRELPAHIVVRCLWGWLFACAGLAVGPLILCRLANLPHDLMSRVRPAV